VSVRSVNHETCQHVVLTGSTSDANPDWPTLLAQDRRDEHPLPYLVMSGPVLAGDYSVYVNRAEGMLQSTLDGRIITDWHDGASILSPQSRAPVEEYLARRIAARQAAAVARGAPTSLVDNHAEAMRRANVLMRDSGTVSLENNGDLIGQIDVAVVALRNNLSRCATVSAGFNWDTHVDNGSQTEQWENLADALQHIVQTLAATTDDDGTPLSASTLVVVFSEMARTPAYNATGGRDHWPFTSMMMMGPGISGNRTIGGYTDGYLGVGVDVRSGELDDSKPGILSSEIGATLLTLGGVDARAFLPFAEPIAGVLR
jgi:uncharacterized protein (DUF1501 family)